MKNPAQTACSQLNTQKLRKPCISDPIDLDPRASRNLTHDRGLVQRQRTKYELATNALAIPLMGAKLPEDELGAPVSPTALESTPEAPVSPVALEISPEAPGLTVGAGMHARSSSLAGGSGSRINCSFW